MKFQFPPRVFNLEHRVRKVGVELEFSGLNLRQSAEAVAKAVGGEWQPRGDYEAVVNSERGDFRIEFDSNFFKKKRYDKYISALGLDSESSTLGAGLKSIIERFGEMVIPFEVVTPPLPMLELEIVEDIREGLRMHSAKGTTSSIINAFGLQFNPEVPDFTSATLTAYLKAFFLMFDQLFAESHIPLSRQLAPYIHRFPEEYVNLVIDPDYDPDIEKLMIDYLEFNPTRNRPLDMLPLFAHMNADLVFSYPVERDLVNKRPTFHYRLPNSEIDDPKWTIAQEWNRWVEIERLACNREKLTELCREVHLAHA